jgi:hypothetical protein
LSAAVRVQFFEHDAKVLVVSLNFLHTFLDAAADALFDAEHLGLILHHVEGRKGKG